MDVIERKYGIAGRAAGEAALEFGAGRKATDAFVLSRIARAVVDALETDDRGAVDRIERAAALLARVGVGDKPMAAKDGEDVQAAYRILTGGQS